MIFRKFIDKKTNNQVVRVSLFRVFNGDTENPHLKVVGRHQTKSPVKKSSLVFKAGEGAVGIAYTTGQCVRICIDEYQEGNVEKYYQESLEKLSLPKNKAEKLNEKACDFLCIPIKYFQEDKPWGVLSIDSIKRDSFDINEAREIDLALSCVPAFLMIN